MTTPPETETRSKAIPWLFLVIGLVIGGVVGFYLRPVVTPPVSGVPVVAESEQISEPDPHQAVMMAVIAGARHFQGDPNAPVTLIEFGDFKCGYCAKWSAETLPRIKENYIETGQVRMGYVHYPFLSPDSMTGAEATECAARQDKFWEYHNLLYANQQMEFSVANLVDQAAELELDTAAFEECLTNFSDRAVLEEDIRLAQVMGVRGTPAFVLNGVAIAGAYPYEQFEQLIEQALADDF